MKKINHHKKLLALLMAVVMLLGMAPVAAASNETEWGPIEYFYEPANNSSSYYLLTAERHDLKDPDHMERAAGATGYEMDPLKTVQKYSTCTEPGFAYLETGAIFPSHCSWATTSEPITATVPCLAHSLVYSQEESTPATYRTDGVRVLICSRCGARVEEVSPRLIPPLPAALPMSYFPTCEDNPDHYMYKSYYALNYLSAEEIQLQEDDYYHVKIHFDPAPLLEKFNYAYGLHALVEDTFPAIPYVYDYNDNTWTQDDEPTVRFTCKSVTPPAPVEIPQLIVNMPEAPVVNTAIADFLQDDPDTPYTVTGTWWKLGAEGAGVMRLEAGKPAAAGEYELRLTAVPREGYVFKSEVYYDPIRDYLTPDENGNILLTEKYTVKPLEVTVNFHLNGGLTGPTTMKAPCDESLDLSLVTRATHDPVNGIPVIHVGWATFPTSVQSHNRHCSGAYRQVDDSIYLTSDIDLYAVYSLDENGNGLGDSEEDRYPADLEVKLNDVLLTGTAGADSVIRYSEKISLNTSDKDQYYLLDVSFLDQFGDKLYPLGEAIAETYTGTDTMYYDPNGLIWVKPAAAAGETVTVSFPSKAQMAELGTTLPTHTLTFVTDAASVNYEVIHMVEDVENAPGTYKPYSWRAVSGKVGEMTAVVPLDWPTLIMQPFEQKVIAADGSTKVTIFYDYKRVPLTWDFGPFTPTSNDYPHGMVPIVANITPPKLDQPAHILFEGYDKHLSMGLTDDGMHISAIWTSDLHSHKLVHVASVAPTQSEDGVKEYYLCKNCGKCFEDLNTEIEIADLNLWKQGDGKLPMLQYAIVEGNNSEWTAGSADGLRFVTNGTPDKLQGILVDGAEVSPENYTTEEGSAAVTLNAAYLETLAYQQHELTFRFTDGTVSGSFTTRNASGGDPTKPVVINEIVLTLPETPLANSASVRYLENDLTKPYIAAGDWYIQHSDGSITLLKEGTPVVPGAYMLTIRVIPRDGYAFKPDVSYKDLVLHPENDGSIAIIENYVVAGTDPEPVQPDRTVSFFLNGGIAGPASVTVKDGAILNFSSLPLAVHPSVNGIPVIHLGWDTGIFEMLDHSKRNPRILYTNSDSLTVTRDMTLSAVYGLDENRNGIADCIEKLVATDIRFTFDKSVMTPVISPDGVREYTVELPSNTGTDRVSHMFYGEFLNQFGEMQPEFPRPLPQNTTNSDHMIYDPTGYIMVLPGEADGESLTISFPNNGQKEKYGPDLPTYRVTFRITDEVVPYTVVHKLENWEQNPGTYVEKVQQTAYGIAGTQTAAAPHVFADFTPKAIEQKEIAADGSTVITVFYDRDRYNLTWDFGPASPVDDNYPNGLTPVGKVCIPPKLTEVEGLKFSRFFPKIPFTMPAKDATISAIWQVEEKPQEFVYHVNGKAPTHTEDGWKGYYVSCGSQRYYEDCYANVEIPNLQQWLQGPGKLPKLPYVILEGDNSQWTSGSAEGLRFRSDGEFSTFQGIQVDGQDVGRENFTAEEGSTIVNLKPAYLKTLAHREHTLTFLFTGGSVSASFSVKSAPVNPDVPADPDAPVNPEPGDPDAPVNPKPGDPDTPVNPKPGDPDAPVNPKPGDPDAPVNPKPGDPDASEKPSVPGKPVPPTTDGAVATGDSFHVISWAVLSMVSLCAAFVLSLNLRKKQSRR